MLSRTAERLWAVADGMGGHQAGDVASQAITAALLAVPLSGPLSAQLDAVEDVLVSVNDELRLHARCRGATTIGSTVVSMIAQGELAAVLWAGDSRLYRLRDGKLEQITRDHNPISDLLDAGTVSEEQAQAADTNVITRAVGGQPQLYLDVAVFDVACGDTFLLCTDGLYRELADDALGEALAGNALDGAAETLLARCLEGPARDNVSLVIARPELQ